MTVRFWWSRYRPATPDHHGGFKPMGVPNIIHASLKMVCSQFVLWRLQKVSGISVCYLFVWVFLTMWRIPIQKFCPTVACTTDCSRYFMNKNYNKQSSNFQSLPTNSLFHGVSRPPRFLVLLNVVGLGLCLFLGAWQIPGRLGGGFCGSKVGRRSTGIALRKCRISILPRLHFIRSLEWTEVFQTQGQQCKHLESLSNIKHTHTYIYIFTYVCII